MTDNGRKGQNNKNITKKKNLKQTKQKKNLLVSLMNFCTVANICVLTSTDNELSPNSNVQRYITKLGETK